MVSQNSIRYAFKNSMVSQVLRGRTSAYLDRPIKNALPNEHLRWEEKFEKWSRRSAGNWGWRVFCSLWGEAHIFGGERWWDLFYIEIPGGTVCSKNIHMCRFHLHPLFKENEIEIAFEICNGNGNKLVNQQLCFKSQIILVNGRIDLMFMNDKHRRMVYFKLNLTCYE